MNQEDFPPFPFPQLTIPTFEPRLDFKEDKWWIFDSLRKKFLVLTPEEWVRQHWVQFLILGKNYPKGLFSIEKGLKYNSLQKRTDVLVFDRNGLPYLLIECKAPEVKLNAQVLSQAMTYLHRIECPHLILSNGLNHLVFSWSEKENKLLQSQDLPKSPN